MQSPIRLLFLILAGISLAPILLLFGCSSNPPAVVSLTFSPDGKYLAAGYADGHLCLWNVNTGSCENRIQVLNNLRRVTFSSDGYFIAAAGGKEVKIIKTISNDITSTLLGHAGEVFDITFSPDGEYLLSGSMDGTARLWNMSTKTTQYVLVYEQWFDSSSAPLLGRTKWKESVAYSPNGKWIAIAESYNTISIWESSLISSGQLPAISKKSIDQGAWLFGKEPDQATFRLSLDKGRISRIAFSNNDILTVVSDGGITFWDYQTRSFFNYHNPALNRETGKSTERFFPICWDGAVSSDGKWAAAALEDGTTIVWDNITGYEHRVFNGNRDTGSKSLDFSPDGQLLGIGNRNGTINLINIYSGQVVKQLL